MYELDHMLNGKGSRSHLEEMAKEAKLAKLAREAQADKQEHTQKTDATRRTIFSTAVLLLTRWS